MSAGRLTGSGERLSRKPWNRFRHLFWDRSKDRGDTVRHQLHHGAGSSGD